MNRPSRDEIRRAVRASLLGVALGFLLLIVERTRTSSASDRRA